MDEYEKITQKDLEANKDPSMLHLGEMRRYKYFFRQLREDDKAKAYMADQKVKAAEQPQKRLPKKSRHDRSHLKFTFDEPE